MVRCGCGVLLVFLSLFRGAILAQSGSLSIAGYVRDESTQEAISSARVELQTLSGVRVGQADISGSSGQFHLAADAGEYYLIAERSGFQPAKLTLGSLPQSNVVVLMHRLHPGDGSSSQGSVSLHELSIPAKARSAFAKGADRLAKDNPDYGRAIAEFQRAIKEFPSYYEAYTEMSIAQFRSGDNRSAEESLRKAAELSENHYAKGMALLAELLNSQNRFVEAESAARQAVAADGSSWRGPCQLARALSGLRQPSEAEASAKRALELDPGNSMVLLVLGNIHVQERNYLAAAHDFDQYLGRVPSGPQSDMVRKSRDQIQRVLATREAGAAIQGP
jgi:tetratricopeptide (TPR) repeat protein